MIGKKAFTLIEAIVAVGVVGMVLPVFFSIVFLIMRQQLRIAAVKEIKRQGDFVLNNMETTIRNCAQTIHNYKAAPIVSAVLTDNNRVCDVIHGSAFDQTVTFKDRFGNGFRYIISGNRVASDSANAATVNLTNSKVKVEPNGSLPFIQCAITNPYSPPIVTVNYKISYKTSGSALESNVSLVFQSKIKLKSY